MSARSALLVGARLGVYQAHALAGPPLALAALLAGVWRLALILTVAAAIGWTGWHRDFGLCWRITEEER